MTKEEEITQLTDLYYRMISIDHHKDGDCHWYINKFWSYGQRPFYRIEHYGYIYKLDNEDEDAIYSTYEHAEGRLLEIIRDAINEEKDWASKVAEFPLEYDGIQLNKAEEIIKLTREGI